MDGKIGINEIAHICVLVNDIEKAIELVEKTFDVPPIKVRDFTSTARLKGKEIGKYRLKIAMVKIANNMPLEFLQIVEGKSVEQDWLKRHGETIHHIAVRVDDIEKKASEWEKKGIRILQEDHGRWFYLDTEKILGLNVELVPSR